MGLVAVALAVCAVAASARGAEPLPVFVSVPPLKTFVEAVGGDRVAVTSLVGPGQSPATYDPLPREMAALEGARLYFRVGAPFENVWMPRIRDLAANLRVVDLRQGLPLPETDAGEDAGHDHGHGGALDPHVWNSPPLARPMAAAIRDALIAADPTGDAEYRLGHAALDRALESLDAELRKTLGDVAGRRFMVFHPAWGHFARAYGLEQVAVEIEGKEPGPRELASLIERARAERVRVIFVQPQFAQTGARVIAEAIGARVEPADPLAADYFGNMRRVARAIAGALKQP